MRKRYLEILDYLGCTTWYAPRSVVPGGVLLMQNVQHRDVFFRPPGLHVNSSVTEAGANEKGWYKGIAPVWAGALPTKGT